MKICWFVVFRCISYIMYPELIKCYQWKKNQKGAYSWEQRSILWSLGYGYCGSSKNIIQTYLSPYVLLVSCSQMQPCFLQSYSYWSLSLLQSYSFPRLTSCLISMTSFPVIQLISSFFCELQFYLKSLSWRYNICLYTLLLCNHLKGLVSLRGLISMFLFYYFPV